MEDQSVPKIKNSRKKGAKNENGQIEDMIISDKTPEENQIYK